MAVSTVLPPASKKGSTRIYYGEYPTDEPKALKVEVDLTSSASYLVDLTAELENGALGVIQTVFADNSANAAVLTIACESGQNIIVPKSSQGYFPIIAGNPPRFVVSLAAAGQKVTLMFINIPMPVGTWAAV